MKGNTAKGEERIVLALFDHESKAEAAVKRLAEENFPLDMVSLLGKGRSSGDDPIGIYWH